MDTHQIGAHAPGLAKPEGAARLPEHIPSHVDAGLGSHAEPSNQEKAAGAWQGDATAADRTHTDSASSDADRKAIATLRAVAALRGVRVDPIESDGGALVWIVTRWNLTRQCNTFSELRTFLKQMGIEA